MSRSFGLAPAERTEAGDRARILAAARKGGEGARAAALFALGRQGDDVLLEFVDELDDMSERVEFRILEGLRDMSSPASLRWARSAAGSDGNLAAPAISILSAHGMADDVGQLRDLLPLADEDGWIYVQCHLVEGLHRLTDTAGVPAIERLYRTTPYSYRLPSTRTRQHDHRSDRRRISGGRGRPRREVESGRARGSVSISARRSGPAYLSCPTRQESSVTAVRVLDP